MRKTKIFYFFLIFIFILCSGLSIVRAQNTDSDGDGVANVNDLDDDNDGIPDAVEFNEQLICLNFSNITNNSPNINTPLTLLSNGTGSYSVNYTASFSSVGTAANPVGFTAPKGDSNGNISIGINGGNSESQYMQYVISFTKPIIVRISDRNVTNLGLFDFADSWRITATGGLSQINTTGIIVTSTSTNDITFSPTALSNQPFELRTIIPVTSITIKMWTNNGTNNVSPLRICSVLPMDTDNDGNPDYLDLDSDNDGCPDAIEGDENVLESQLNANGSINTVLPTPNNDVGSSASTLGIPNLVNSGGGADIGSDPGQGVGASIDRLINSCVCYNNANTTGTGTPTKHGITLLKRAGPENGNWPMGRISAHTVLESNTKGLVITRMTSDPAQADAANHLNKIISPQEGMIVYDLFSKCLKIYSDGSWGCFSTPTCP